VNESTDDVYQHLIGLPDSDRAREITRLKLIGLRYHQPQPVMQAIPAWKCESGDCCLTCKSKCGPAWKYIPLGKCCICHRPLTRDDSIKLRIGSAVCRPRVEASLGFKLTEDMNPFDLEVIWCRFNHYGFFINGVTRKIKKWHTERRLGAFFSFEHDERIFVYANGVYRLLCREEAEDLYMELKTEQEAT
jgi:hypothetical protein